MLIDKYKRIIKEQLPQIIQDELTQIATDTNNFTDEEVTAIYESNFNDLYAIIEKQYPQAIKPKMKLVKKTLVKVIKKAEKMPNKKIVKRASSKKKLVKKVTELNCDEAIEKLEEIEKKKEDVIKKRAETPKKKISKLAEEKQVKAVASIFKTKVFKSSKQHAESFGKDLVELYKKHKLITIAENLQKDIDQLILDKYKE